MERKYNHTGSMSEQKFMYSNSWSDLAVCKKCGSNLRQKGANVVCVSCGEDHSSPHKWFVVTDEKLLDDPSIAGQISAPSELSIGLLEEFYLPTVQDAGIELDNLRERFLSPHHLLFVHGASPLKSDTPSCSGLLDIDSAFKWIIGYTWSDVVCRTFAGWMGIFFNDRKPLIDTSRYFSTF